LADIDGADWVKQLQFITCVLITYGVALEALTGNPKLEKKCKMSPKTEKYEYLDPKVLAVDTPPPTVGVGRKAAANLPTPRPDLAGLRIALPEGRSGVYLIAPDGYKRGVPDPTTYNNLFRDWNGIVTSIDITQISDGPGLASGTILIDAPGYGVFILDNGVRKGISSPAIMDKYYFNWGRIVTRPAIVMNAIPAGSWE
jgi:hypothetical protein